MAENEEIIIEKEAGNVREEDESEESSQHRALTQDETMNSEQQKLDDNTLAETEQEGEGDPNPDKEQDFETESKVDPAVAELLTKGFVERFLPGLQKTRDTVDQIRSSQVVLLETVQQEMAKFRECHAVNQVEATMTKARHYHSKLLRLRREMTALHDKSKKLKKRALKLQQQKQSEELTRAHTREHELERERMLTARVASAADSSTH